MKLLFFFSITVTKFSPYMLPLILKKLFILKPDCTAESLARVQRSETTREWGPGGETEVWRRDCLPRKSFPFYHNSSIIEE